MKKLAVLIPLIFPILVFAQSVAISTDASLPHGSAILDIKSDSKGLLTPRLTTLQRTSIAGPAIGLTVFDLDTYSYWMFRGDLYGGWAELQHNYQSLWTGGGGHIFNKNNGNVGIGTNTPASKLTINGTDPVIGIMNNGLSNSYIQADGFNMRISTGIDNITGKLLLGTKGNDHMSIDHYGRVSIGTNSDFDAEMKLNGSGNVRFAFLRENVQKGIIRLQGDDFKIGTYGSNSGNIVFSPKLVDKIWINEEGLMGIGTASPVSLLTINGSNPYIQMQHNAVNKGFFQVVNNDLRVGTNSTNTTGNLVFQTKLLDRMTIDENGLIGIGTTSPSSVLTVNGLDPIIQLRNNNVDKGFIQLVGDDIRIGTNSTNDFGSFIVRTNGADRMTVNEFGRVGIGTTFVGYHQLAVGENFNGQSGVDFFDGNTQLGALSIGSTDGSLIQYDGNFRISVNGPGFNLLSNGNFTMGGSAAATGYRLSVHGKVIATDYTTLPINSWPDYVFANNYQLMPLAEVKEFIEKNKHLPNIPSAAEIEKEGIQLGDMSKRLMEKIEELTLYILQQQEQIDELKKQVQAGKEK